MKRPENLLASEFYNLSRGQERSNNLNDLYCMGDDIDESPALFEKSLAQFEQALQQGNFPMYETAVAQNRAYVEDPSFRLKFLRANLYNVTTSVNQMVDFLNQKAMYFGVDKVARDITLDDLSSEELDLMLSGRYHIQDGTDTDGRVILYSFSATVDNCQDVSMVVRSHAYYQKHLSLLDIIRFIVFLCAYI
mmetsp:Transcript_26854/g.65263  ORF Transcript_26854/g.65263 Transcript_26854/m.65263 type:complete len:192 (-) Transcript_26854:1309-1884(-)